jgi:hypothetical protein
MSVLKPPVKARPYVDPHIAQAIRLHAQRLGVSEFDAACITIQRLRAVFEAAQMAGPLSPEAKA